MDQAIVIKGSPASMTSREMAELTEKRHDNVKRTIDTLAASGVISLPQIEEVPSDGPGRSTITQYRIGKRDSYIIVAQLSPEFTARLVDRWQELEDAAPVAALPDFGNPAAAARAWADAIEAKTAALALADHATATKAEIGNRREATAMNTASLRIVSEFPRYIVSRDGEVYVTTKTNSRTGEVSTRDVPKKLKHVLDVYGYRVVSLRSGDAKRVAKVHRLVASAFLENPHGKPQVNHINGIKHDNRAANLEWVTGSENQIHSHQVLHTKANSYWTGKENKHLQKPVAQVSLDGVLMRIWPSMKSISLSGAACKSSVEKSLKSGRPTGGFYLYPADVWREVYALAIEVPA